MGNHVGDHTRGPIKDGIAIALVGLRHLIKNALHLVVWCADWLAELRPGKRDLWNWRLQLFDNPIWHRSDWAEIMPGAKPQMKRPPDDVAAFAPGIDALCQFAGSVFQSGLMLEQQMNAARFRRVMPRVGQVWRMSLQPVVGFLVSAVIDIHNK